MLLERSFVSGNNSRLALAEFGVELVGFCDDLLRAFVRLQLQLGISKFELLYSAVWLCPFLMRSFFKKVGQSNSTCTSSGFRLVVLSPHFRAAVESVVGLVVSSLLMVVPGVHWRFLLWMFPSLRLPQAFLLASDSGVSGLNSAFTTSIFFSSF